MTTIATASEAQREQPDYLHDGYGVKSWLLTTDHKRIAILYLFSVTLFFALGGVMAALIRIELATPQGDLVEAAVYNRLFTMHGVLMIFFFLIPAIPGVFGNFFMPIMVGARDMAFPKINLLSWYLYMAGGICAFYSMAKGGVDTGWTFYAPFSTGYSNSYVVSTAVGALLVGFSSILTGLNFLVTTHRMRAPGLSWFRLPLFVWGHYATALIMILGTPVLAITLILVALERVFQLGIFDPSIGGDPVLFQHLFWFYSHPAVYIMVLPAMAIISELIANFARRRVFGYRIVAYSSVGIAILGFLVWGHHMFVSSQSVYAATVFSILTMLVAVPSAIKVFNWTMTLYQGSISWETPMLYAIGFMGLFMIGGFTGVMLGTLGIDMHVHDTYFVVAHFHYVMVGGALMAYLGGLHYWWPKMFGRLYPKFWSKVAAMLVFAGFNLTFFPQFILGYMGMPRRYHAYPPEFQVLNVLSSAGATILAVGYIIPIIYFAWSLRFGKKCPPNPWGAVGLEWQETASPPIKHNFDHPVIVDYEAYDFSRSPAVSPDEEGA